MSTYDPRLLIRVLSDLEEKFQRFTSAFSDTMKEAEYIQICAEERINQALRWSGIANDQVKSYLENVQEIEAEVSSLLNQCSTATETSHETLRIVNQAKQQAELTRDNWENELQIALAWQARAEARLDRALQIYQKAQRNLESARNSLSRAEASLQRCIKNPDRKNCNSEERAYNNAKAAVLVALEELKEAEIEVQAAQEELERAKARVRCCQNAVNYANQAVHYAELAAERANQAVNSAERSLESVESANRAVTSAQSKATEAEQQAEQLLIKVHQTEAFTNEAQVYNQNSRLLADSAHRLSKLGTLELGDRILQLRSLNQPLVSPIGYNDTKASSLSNSKDKENPWGQWFAGIFSKENIENIPPGLKGLYYIHNKDYSQAYTGKSDSCVKGRLRKHLRGSKNKALKKLVDSEEELFFYCHESPDPKYEEAIEIQIGKSKGLLKKQKNEWKPLIPGLDFVYIEDEL